MTHLCKIFQSWRSNSLIRRWFSSLTLCRLLFNRAHYTNSFPFLDEDLLMSRISRCAGLLEWKPVDSGAVTTQNNCFGECQLFSMWQAEIIEGVPAASALPACQWPSVSRRSWFSPRRPTAWQDWTVPELFGRPGPGSGLKGAPWLYVITSRALLYVSKCFFCFENETRNTQRNQ